MDRIGTKPLFSRFCGLLEKCGSYLFSFSKKMVGMVGFFHFCNIFRIRFVFPACFCIECTKNLCLNTRTNVFLPSLPMIFFDTRKRHQGRPGKDHRKGKQVNRSLYRIFCIFDIVVKNTENPDTYLPFLILKSGRRSSLVLSGLQGIIRFHLPFLK